MPISFLPLEKLLSQKGLSKSILKTRKIVGGGTYTIIAKSIECPIVEGVSISAVDSICRYFDVQPGDIMEYVPEGEGERLSRRSDEPEPEGAST